jgi:2-iminobutanoate/2-iminopropanoate deaminase
MKLFILLAVATLAFAEKKPFAPKDFAKGRPFSAAILSGGTLYVSGQVGAKKDGSYAEKFEDEVQQCFDEILKSAGHGMQDLVAVQVYLTDMDMFARMNEVYVKNVPEPRPTRTTVGVAKLVGKARIEITVTARK